MTRRMRNLAAVHLPANALLLWLGYYWLGVGETRTLTLLWSAVVALAVLCLACWLHGGTLGYFKVPDAKGAPSLPDAFRTALRNLAAVVAVAIAALVLYFLLARWEDYSSTPALRIASWLTQKIRKPVKPDTVGTVFNVALWLVRWMIVPVFLLPLAAGVAARGWRGAGEWKSRARRRLYWIETPVLLVCALWAPLKLVGWIPQLNGFWMEMASFALRALAAYALFVASWLALAALTAGGMAASEAKPAEPGA